MAAFGLFTPTAQARVRAACTHHATSHGGHYSAGHGASHKGGSYRRTSTNNRYRRHKS
ncbi:hypothetical protein DGM85_00655 [Xanthomonas phaseoli pv. phaseoli]|nr:hypothetical protein DGM93_22035 [Xanthomonas phaseoli pv. phaseoli]QWN30920.1 hypothetical protein DGM85_00655 [Xanthomonas phaseoli pv. phaseoli]QWN35373.1 hypothetical protein DGM81_21795 [Xanthomonas phaseoli pv. phaseoli]